MTQIAEDIQEAVEQVQEEALPETGQETRPPETSTELEPGPPTATAAPDDLATQMAERLSEMDRASARRLDELQRQLSRVEGRFDKGQDAASIREMRKEIASLKATTEGIDHIKAGLSRLDALDQIRDDSATRLDAIDDLWEAMTLVLKRNLEPEEFAAVDKRFAEKRVAAERKRSEDRATREKRVLEQRATQAEERVAKTEKALADSLATVHMPPEADRAPTQTPAPAMAPEVEAAAVVLNRRLRKAGYDPDDAAFQQRLLAAAGGDLTNAATPAERLEALTDALVEIQGEDRKVAVEGARKAIEESAKREAAKTEADKRTAARTAVQTDRTRAASSTRSYTTQRELEAAFAKGEVDPGTVRQLLPTLPY